MILIQIAGHLGADPEVRFTPAGVKVTNLRVAVNIKRGGKEKTVWWKVTCWGDRFDKKLQYLKKGSAVIVVGEMGIPDMYQDREGNTQVNFEIIAEFITFSPFGGKQQGQGADAEGAGAQEFASQKFAQHASPIPSFGDAQPQTVRAGAQSTSSGPYADDDIPF